MEKKKLQLLQEKLAKEKNTDIVPAIINPEEMTATEKGDEKRIHFKKNMLKKTRSKQKGKKKDNRPIEVKREKLALKGIIIWYCLAVDNASLIKKKLNR